MTQPERHFFLVQTNPVEGSADEYNDWYTNTHLGDVLTVPGFVAAQRFQLSTARRDAEQPDYTYGYIAIYEIEGDPQEALDNLAKLREGFYISPAMAEERDAYVFTPITERRTADGK